MNEVGIVILCRYSSSRLPGKILMEIDGKPILKHIYDRIAQVVPSKHIIVATSEESSDQPIEDFCRKENMPVYRGSLSNVAQRFYEAGKVLGTPYICRINGDNFFIDPNLLEAILSDDCLDQYDLITNVPGRTFPFGMSIEILNTEFYKNLLTQIDTDRYREHVTLYLYEESKSHRQKTIENTYYPSLKGVNLAVDTLEDYQRTQVIFKLLKENNLSITGKNIAQVITQIENI